MILSFATLTVVCRLSRMHPSMARRLQGSPSTIGWRFGIEIVLSSPCAAGRPIGFVECLTRLLHNTVIPSIGENGVWMWRPADNSFSCDPSISEGNLEMMHQARRLLRKTMSQRVSFSSPENLLQWPCIIRTRSIFGRSFRGFLTSFGVATGRFGCR